MDREVDVDADATVDVERRVSDVVAALRGPEFRGGDLDGVVATFIEMRRGLQHRQFDGLIVDEAIRHALTHCLERADGTIELLPIARVLRGETHSAIRDARNDRAHGDRDAIERPSEDVVALVDGAEDSIVADANALERHFEQRLVIRRLLTSH